MHVAAPVMPAMIGPQIPNELLANQSDSEDDGTFGPLPCRPGEEHDTTAADDFARRAEQMKDKLLTKVSKIICSTINIYIYVLSSCNLPSIWSCLVYRI